MRTHGIGLGLYICRKLCAQYNGEIGVSSKENEGTTITFSLTMFQQDFELLSSSSVSLIENSFRSGGV